MRIEVPEDVEWIIGEIRKHGFEAYAVGGCVRDTLLHRIPGDWDMTTSAEPEDIKAIFPRTIDTGIEHGTVTVMRHHCGYEVTTYRIDGEYVDCRHPETVEFTKSLREDLKRRDFTINAMAYSHETGIVDEFGGMEDLSEKMIRCVGEPMDRFTEDALRILRAVRFAAQLGFTIEEKTYRAISAIAPNLLKVSQERIQVELTKLLCSDHPEKSAMLFETGIADYVTDGFEKVMDDGGPHFDSLRELTGDRSIRWAGFLMTRTPEEAFHILKGLKFDNETKDNVRNILMVAQAEIPLTKPVVRRILNQVTMLQFDGAMELRRLYGRKDPDDLSALRDEIMAAGDCVSLSTLAVNGGDLIREGMKPGKGMGEMLHGLLELVFDDPSLNQKEILLEKFHELNEKNK